MRNKRYKLLMVACCLASALGLKAQQVNTMYFMDNIPYRNFLNPAFQPYSNFYLGLPALGYTQFGLGNNSLSLKDFVYSQDGKPIMFLHPNGDVDKFYNRLRPVTLLQENAQINLLNFGFRKGEGYWNFALTQRVDACQAIPRDFMKFLLYGTPQLTGNTYDLKKLGINASAFTEAGLGYSRILNERLTVGAKLKMLVGTANISVSNDQFDLNAGIDQWTMKGNGRINAALPGTLTVGDRFKSLDYTSPSGASGYIKPSGMGAGMDLGATYKLLDQLTLSASLTDLGFIRWKNNVTNANYTMDYTFTGAGKIDVNAKTDIEALADSMQKAFENSYVTSTTNNAYSTYLSPKLNLGGEYGFWKNRLTLGLLSSTQMYKSYLCQEFTGSVNVKPIDWFNFSTSYSVMNGRMSNIGAGIGVRSGIFHWFLAADYIPLRFATLPDDVDLGPIKSVPYNTKGVNLAFGLSFVIGNRKDADRDGVVDRKDKCPETPFSVVVDKNGCPLDTDGDGVPDYLDKCPGTPPEAYNRIDQHGCPTDLDGDGVADYLDKCPDTPIEARGFVDNNGCPLDTDGDGVFDYKDKCPETPVGVKVDSVGCPRDTDGDGVADFKDKCPDTPVAARGFIDANGCPLDTDGDGVADYLDKCPDTPVAARGFIDANGCPLDTDGDGVADYLDKCPDTPAEARATVDQNGCPRDTDGDGVLDYLDNCPKVPGVASNHGCPEVKKEVKKLFQKALRGIQFETGKYTIKPVSFKILNEVAAALVANPTYIVEIQGHTDNVGKPASNLILSDNRAKAVMEYLINKGVAANRMTAKGYGDTVPVATNKTVAGKALNRRVEFVVTFEEVSFE